MYHTVRHRMAHARLIHSLFILLLCWLLPFNASAQFNPAPGPINDSIQFNASTSATSGPYSLTRSGMSFTVSRPGLADFTFTAPGLLGASTEQAAHAFIGSDGLLIRSSSSTNIENRTTLVFKQLDTADPVQTLVNHQAFLTDQPTVQIRRSSDGLVLFTWTAHADAAINDTFDIALYRGDTGRHLCGMIPFNRDPGDQTTAEVLGSGGNATGLRITRTRQNFPDVTQDCALPQALFEATPQAIDFGEVANNQSPQLQVTLSNPGGPADDAIEVSAIATTTHCTPVGFTPSPSCPATRHRSAFSSIRRTRRGRSPSSTKTWRSRATPRPARRQSTVRRSRATPCHSSHSMPAASISARSMSAWRRPAASS